MTAILVSNGQGGAVRLGLFPASGNIKETSVGICVLAVGGPVEHPSGRPRWRTRPILVDVLVIAALLATLALAPEQARTRIDAMTGALTDWLWPTRWVWPLAAALTFVALSIPPARRRWPQLAGRIPLAIGVFAGLVALASLATVSRPGVGLLALVVVVGVGLLAAWAFLVPRRIVPRVPQAVLDRLPSDRERLEITEANAKLRHEVRTTALQALGGLAVLAGAVLAFQQLTKDRHQANATRELTLRGQASERFTRAIDQLGSDRREVQLGGIYGLEQIAEQAPENSPVVTEVLVAYLHRRAPRPAQLNTERPEELRVRAPDIQAALTVLGRRKPTDPFLDLRALDLRGADLSGGSLSRALLRNSDLRGANLIEADLTGADLEGADLSNAFLLIADLRTEVIYRTKFHGADLRRAKLSGSFLARVDLSDANLSGADLSDTELVDVDLSGAKLAGANLRRAKADHRTRWPNGFDWRRAGVRTAS